MVDLEGQSTARILSTLMDMLRYAPQKGRPSGLCCWVTVFQPVTRVNAMLAGTMPAISRLLNGRDDGLCDQESFLRLFCRQLKGNMKF